MEELGLIENQLGKNSRDGRCLVDYGFSMVISWFSSCIDSSYDFFKPLEKPVTHHVYIIGAVPHF